MGAEQFVHEPSLFEDREGALPAGTQQAGNTLRRVLPARDVWHTFDAQFHRTTITAKTIQ